LATGSPLQSNPPSTLEDGWSLPRPLSLQSDSSVQLAGASPAGAIGNYFSAPSFLSFPMDLIFSSRTHSQLTNSTPSGMQCAGGQLIVFIPLLTALYTGKPHHHPFPKSVNNATGQPPSTWAALLPSLILLLPGYLSLCQHGTKGLLRMITFFSFEDPRKLFTSPHGTPQELTPPSPSPYTHCVTISPTSSQKSRPSHLH